jgi:fatty-acyl-CoA synthase
VSSGLISFWHDGWMPIAPAYDWVAHHAMVSPDRPAWADIDVNGDGAGLVCNWREADERVGRSAAMLRDDFDVGRGDRVVMFSMNRVEFIEVQFACARLGAVFVPVNWRLTVHELDYIVGDAGATVLCADPEFGDTAAELAKRTNVAHLVVFSGAGSRPEGSVDYDDGLAAAANRIDADPAAAPVMPELTHDDPLTIMYTSGTTGRPKGAIITHGMSFWNSVNLAELSNLSRSMVNFCFLPLFHTGGLNCYTNPAAYFGGSTLIMRTFDPGEALDLVNDPERGITHFLGVPANYLFMGQHERFETTDFSRMVTTAIGGAPAALPLLQMWETVGCPLVQAFGMTETSPMVTSISPEMAVMKAGSAGLAAMNTAIRIVGEDGSDVAAGEIGELWCKGPNITPGYWNNPEATAEAITDGWLHTGDAAQMDEDGYMYIVDRWKDMYISGGENVYPSEVESTLFDLPGIADVAVIGLPDEKWGEVGQAVIVRSADSVGSVLDETAILNFCRERLARFKVPQSVRFIDELPRNATGKILKRELRD